MDDESHPTYRSHFLPRTRDGWIATVAFLAVFGLAMPPVTHAVLNRVEPTVLGLPFLYVALLAVYVTLIGILVGTLWRGV